jgi:RsiW-degrading membrane proteinase PrsW (M82 family)
MRSHEIWVTLVVVLSIALLIALFGRRDALPAPVRVLLALLASGSLLIAFGRRSVAP